MSAIIPTYNRRALVERAVRSVLAQSRTVQEIIVVDDGSTDGTGAALASLFGDRIRYVRQDNHGVSSARNRGLELARGAYLALLDSDDEWLPDKTEQQVRWLETHPDYGMVLCDVLRKNAGSDGVERLRRRERLPEDGYIFKWVLLEPALAPPTVLMRRQVYETIGGFDETLPTAEDLDYHLRIAARFKIGLIEEPLVRVFRDRDGLSDLARTDDDYVRVVERAVTSGVGEVSPRDRDRALARAYARSARGMVMNGRHSEAWSLARRAWSLDADPALRRQLLALMPLALRSAISRSRASERGQAGSRT